MPTYIMELHGKYKTLRTLEGKGEGKFMCIESYEVQDTSAWDGVDRG